MQSMMVTINAQKLLAYQGQVSQKASGEACHYVCAARDSRPKDRSQDTGVILYMEDYRKKAAGTQRRGEQGAHQGRYDGRLSVCPVESHAQRDSRLSVVLEFISTAAIVAMALGALMCFFSI